MYEKTDDAGMNPLSTGLARCGKLIAVAAHVMETGQPIAAKPAPPAAVARRCKRSFGQFQW
jgi:hypothetical protein